MRKILNGADLNNQRITSLGASAGPTDAVNRSELDAAIRGLDWKQEVIAASTGNVSLVAPGATLDGVALSANDRVLLKDQTAPAENGVYVWTAAAAALTRALDADSGTELSGSTVSVQRGTVNADRVYRATADDPLTLGTTPVPFVQVGAAAPAYVGGNGLTLTGTTLDVGAGTGISVGADTVSLDTSVAVRKYAANLGNGSLTAIPVVHGLGTTDVTYSIREVSSGAFVDTDVVVTDANTLTVTFPTAPAAGAYRIVVHG